MKVVIAGGSGSWRGLGGVAAVVLAAIALSVVTGALIPNPWYRMAAMGLVLTALSLAAVPLPWRTLLMPSQGRLLIGVASAALLYAGGAAVFLLVQRAGGGGQMQALYAWRELVPRAVVWPLLTVIVVMEELVWRNAVTWPLATRFGPWRGSVVAAAAFAAAHVAMGVPVLLLATFGAGLFWSLLVVHTRSAVPALVSHLAWDIAVLLLAPYPDVLR